MIFNFHLICDEVEDFQREIAIDADASFLDLNNAILKVCNYTDDQITSFYLCDENWNQHTQIIREEMEETSAEDDDIYIMAETPLRDLLEEEGDRMVFIFDPLSERMFFMKLTEITPSKNLECPVCISQIGQAPAQSIDYDASLSGIDLNGDGIMDDDDQDFYGTDGFNEDEFDSEAYEIEDF